MNSEAQQSQQENGKSAAATAAESAPMFQVSDPVRVQLWYDCCMFENDS